METMFERNARQLKEKYDEKVFLTMTRRQAIEVLHYFEDKKRMYSLLTDNVKQTLGLEDIHHEMEDGEED